MANLSALLDACVIFPNSLVDALFTAAEDGLYQVYFSRKILDEATRNRVKRGRMSETGAKLFQEKVIEAFPEALIEAPPELERMMTNDPKDRHVLASAVHGKVDVIVTSNLKDFPLTALAPFSISAIHPDKFLGILCDDYGDDVLYDLIRDQAVSYNRSFDPQQPDKIPPVTDLELISVFEKEQPTFASRILRHAYGKDILDACHNMLKTVMDQDGEKCFNGENYKIREDREGFSITEKADNRCVMRIHNNDFSCFLKVKDVLKFQEVLQLPDMDRLSSFRVRQ